MAAIAVCFAKGLLQLLSRQIKDVHRRVPGGSHETWGIWTWKFDGEMVPVWQRFDKDRQNRDKTIRKLTIPKNVWQTIVNSNFWTQNFNSGSFGFMFLCHGRHDPVLLQELMGPRLIATLCTGALWWLGKCLVELAMFCGVMVSFDPIDHLKIHNPLRIWIQFKSSLRLNQEWTHGALLQDELFSPEAKRCLKNEVTDVEKWWFFDDFSQLEMLLKWSISNRLFLPLRFLVSPTQAAAAASLLFKPKSWDHDVSGHKDLRA